MTETQKQNFHNTSHLHPNMPKLLDFETLKETLAKYCKTHLAKQQALALEPLTDLQEIKEALSYTSEAREIIEQGVIMPSSLNTDIIDSVRLINMGATLTAPQIKIFSSFAQTITNIKEHFAAVTAPQIAELTKCLPNLGTLSKRINQSISPSGEVLDSASRILGPLRRDLTRIKYTLHERMEIELEKLTEQGIVQEQIITERNHRPVLLIKSEFRSYSNGIVHDVSDSGATVFIEPISVIELGNEVIELQLTIDREETSILRDLSESIATLTTSIDTSIAIYTKLDLAFAKGQMSITQKCCVPVFQSSSKQGTKYNLQQIRHPLLFSNAVPLDVTIEKQTNILLITGPNSGGKTLTIKTIGLLIIMAKCGLHTPAENFELPFIDNIFADIGDYQNMSESLSTFTGQMNNMKNIIANCTTNSVVLLDELGSNTDPEEGSALAKSFLNYFNNNGVMVFATTHLTEICNFIHLKEGMINGNLEFDPITLSPTYEFQIGIPGKSLGIAIAKIAQIPESIIEDATSFLSTEYKEIHSILEDLSSKMSEIQDLKSSITTNEIESKNIKSELEESLASVDQLKLSLINKTKAEIEDKSTQLLSEIEKQFQENKIITSQQYLQHKKDINQVLQMINSPRWEPINVPHKYSKEEIIPNLNVKLHGFNAPGLILSTPDKYNVIEVAVGSIKTKVHINQILDILTDPTPSRNIKTPELLNQNTYPSITEIDFHGYRVHEAIEELDQLINDNFTQGNKQIKIIHGDGTGRLRQSIREFLHNHPLVSNYQARPTFSSDAVTIAYL